MGEMADWHLEQMMFTPCEYCGEIGEHSPDCEWNQEKSENENDELANSKEWSAN